MLVGHHHTQIDTLISLKPETAQVCIPSGAYTMYPRQGEIRTFFQDLEPALKCTHIILHAPLPIGISRISRTYTISMESMHDILTVMGEFELTHLVFHLGFRTTKKESLDGIHPITIEESLKICRSSLMELQPVAKRSGVVLCIENTSGTKEGTEMGTVSEVCGLVDSFQSRHIRMCLDTCHAFSSGYDLFLEDQYKKVLERVEVIHLNPTPAAVRFGSHRDMHRLSTIQETDGLSYDGLITIARELKSTEKMVHKVIINESTGRIGEFNSSLIRNELS